MINAVTMLGGGMWVQKKMGEVALPTFSRPVDEVGAFKFSVRVHSASIPGLSDSSSLKRERPRIEVVLGQARKETELGDYRPDSVRDSSASSASAPKSERGSFNADGTPSLSACPWQFGDTLTFAASRGDVLGPGAQIWLRTQGEVRFGQLFQMNMSSTTDVGVCSVDLRRRVLPACLQKTTPDSTGGSEGGGLFYWETPIMVVPLTHIGGRNQGGASERAWVLGEAAGHVALSFGVNVDPAWLLRSADEATMPLHLRAVQPLKEWSVRTADSVASAAQQITTSNVAVAAGVAGEWSVKGAYAAASGVQWIIENSDIEGCTVKTRDQAARFMDDGFGGQTYVCSQHPHLKRMACEGMPSNSPASTMATPKNPMTRTMMVSPTKSMATVTTASGQSPSSFRVPSLSSVGQASFGEPGTPVAGTVPARQQMSPFFAAPGSQVQDATDGGTIVSGRALSKAASSPAPTPPVAPVAARAEAPAAAPAAASAAAPAAQGSAPVVAVPAVVQAMTQKLQPSSSRQFSSQTYASASAAAPPGGAARSVAVHAQVAGTGPASQPHMVQYAQGHHGLQSRQSFAVQNGLQPSRPSFQVVQAIPYGAQSGLPSRQSFQVVQAAPFHYAQPQYVRPGTL